MKHIFIKDSDSKATELVLTQEQAQHLLTVCRCQVGDTLSAVSKKMKYLCKITAIHKQTLSFEIVSSQTLNKDPFHFTLLQALPKQDKFSDICRACTEAGVHHIIPLTTQRCEVKVKNVDQKRQRWQRILESAAMQAQRQHIPHLDSLYVFNDLSHKKETANTLKLLFWEEAATDRLVYPLLEDYMQQGTKEPYTIQLFIGPEGGITKSEVETLIDMGFMCVSLGNTVLRVEHAGLMALAQIKGYLNYLREKK
ncbi:MAG: RsmE family RNA methyltransferase [bacterium]